VGVLACAGYGEYSLLTCLHGVFRLCCEAGACGLVHAYSGLHWGFCGCGVDDMVELNGVWAFMCVCVCVCVGTCIV
jgi:hypothetical protein